MDGGGLLWVTLVATARRARIATLAAVAALIVLAASAQASVPGATATVRDDNVVTAEDQAVTFDALDNDTAMVPSTVSVASAPADGTATAASDGSITYTPRRHFNGSDQFSYRACSASAQCSTALVRVTVNLFGDYGLLYEHGPINTTPEIRTSFPNGGGRGSFSPPVFGEDAVVSPGGSRIAYAVGGTLTVRDLTSFESQSGSASDVILHPSWNPSGSALVFEAGSDLWTMTLPTTPIGNPEVKPVTYTNAAGDEFRVHGHNPSWGAGGIAFDSWIDPEDDSCGFLGCAKNGISLTLPGQKPVLHVPGHGTQPAWSRDGILYFRNWSNVGCETSPNGTASIARATSGSSQTIFSFPPCTERLYYPAISPDGTKIAFEDGSKISVVNANGSGYTTAINDFDVDPDYPTWDTRLLSSPPRPWESEGRLLYIRAPSAAGDGSLARAAPNGSGHTEFLAAGQGKFQDATQRDPDWSPDGTRVVFSAMPVPRPNQTLVFRSLFSMNADGTNLQQISNISGFLEGKYSDPNWSPDGTQIAYSYEKYQSGVNYDYPTIWLMDSAGGNRHAITTGGVDTDPAWSPDASTIAFTRQGTAYGIMVVSPSGGAVTRVGLGSTGIAYGVNLAWAPDSRRVAFVSSQQQGGGSNELTVGRFTPGAAPAISDVERIYPDELGTDRDPTWSPDGCALAFTHGVSGQPYELRVVNPTGSRSTKMSFDSPSNADSVDWGPSQGGFSTSRVSPGSGPATGGTAVTITGRGFGGPGTTVTFGGTAATVNSGSSTQLNVTAPAHAPGSVDVVVTNPDGKDARLCGSYTYASGPSPSSVSPGSGPAAGGTAVTISGSNFGGPGTTAKFGGTQATVTGGSSTQLNVTTPAHADGAVDVVVTNPDGQSATLSSAFTYHAAPAISSIAPASGTTSGGTAVTITGTFFGGPGTTASFGGAAATVTGGSATEVRLTTPAHASGAVDVTVTNPDGQSTTKSAGYAYVSYVRPRGATPVRMSLVPAFQPCSSPNRTHGPALSSPSCNPPAQSSTQLTVGTPDANAKAPNFSGFAQYEVVTGNPSTPANEADVRVITRLTDVRQRSGLSDYTGELQLDVLARVTDRSNGPDQSEMATTADLRFPATVVCAATSDTAIGSSCDLTSTFNALVPGAVVERKRAIWQLDQIRLFDGGPDGDVDTAGNTLFATQGIFVP